MVCMLPQVVFNAAHPYLDQILLSNPRSDCSLLKVIRNINHYLRVRVCYMDSVKISCGKRRLYESELILVTLSGCVVRRSDRS